MTLINQDFQWQLATLHKLFGKLPLKLDLAVLLMRIHAMFVEGMIVLEICKEPSLKMYQTPSEDLPEKLQRKSSKLRFQKKLLLNIRPERNR